jgi:hypothetical protein
MNSKRLVIGDPHFKRNNIEETDLLVSEIDRLITLEEPDEVILLGDVIDRYSLRTDCRAKEWILRLTTMVERVILIVGNHERENNLDYQSRIHYYVGMEGVEGLEIVDSARMIGSCLYVPYVAPGRFEEAIAPYISNEIEWIFAHQSFIGCSDPCAKDLWAGPQKCISGHIHTRMYLYNGVRSTNKDWDVYYPGAALCNSFIDERDRYICVVEGKSVRDIKIKSIPRHLVILDERLEQDAIDLILVANKYTRIVLEGTIEDCMVLAGSELIRNAKKRGADVRHHFILSQCKERKVDTKKSFTQLVLQALEGRCSAEELSYITSILS